MIVILYRRKPSIFQTQLKDFIGRKFVEKYDMNVPKDYRIARKRFTWIPIHPTWGGHKRKRVLKFPKSQKRITDFIDWVPKSKDKYLYRFLRVKIPRFETFALGTISKMEWDMHRYLKNFDGFFENLFEFNDLSFFYDKQEEFEQSGISFKKMFFLDIVAYELLRINLGFKNYAGLERSKKLMGLPPLFGVTCDPNFFLDASDLSYVLNKIPSEVFFEFFQLLVEECITYGIIVPRILIWDGHFIRSHCKNNKEEGKDLYNDPDAGYCRHNGKKMGVGYDPRILYAFCFNRWFPVYFKIFVGNRNDRLAFKETMREFLEHTEYEWSIVIADSGPYSKQNLEEMKLNGLVLVIRARKGLKTHPTEELKKGFYFNTEYIPKDWSKDLFLKIYSFRPMIEQGNFYNHTYYDAFRMNTRRKEAAIKHRALIYILKLLKALTAYKLGRPDLVMKPSPFESSRYTLARQMLPFKAMDSGYLFFNSLKDLRRQIRMNYGMGFSMPS